jgi:hypothetical protein
MLMKKGGSEEITQINKKKQKHSYHLTMRRQKNKNTTPGWQRKKKLITSLL